METLPSLSHIELLIRAYYKPTLFKDMGFRTEGVASYLCKHQLATQKVYEKGIENIGIYAGDTYLDVTERGKVYVEAIRALPLPEQLWVMPTTSSAGDTDGDDRAKG